MKYQKTIERVLNGELSRSELATLRFNAENKMTAGDVDAQHVLDAIDNAEPKDAYILFMGFCPGADFSHRLDIEWKEKGICRFDYLESEHQAERFNSICSGDLVVLKKIQQFGKTMKLFGHGRVKSVAYDEDDIRYLTVDWSLQDETVEVPLMGCNSTVDVRLIEAVENAMPPEFYAWLGT